MNAPRQIQQLSPEEVYGYLGSRAGGLTSAEVAERLLEVGPNSVEVRDRWRWPRRLMGQLLHFFALLLYLSALLCFFAEAVQPGEGMAVLGWALLGVALLNAGFSFVQEYRAERAMAALRRYLPPRVRVVRSGAPVQALAEELVPGDVLLVSEGDRIPADARLVSADDLLVNSAPLTGEAKPLALQAAASQRRLAESDNILFAGCAVLRGSGEAVVFATGLRSEFGKVAHLSQGIRRDPSPLERQTTRMVRLLTAIAVAMGVSFFLYGVVSGRPLWVNLVFMMGIIVANVPEGLLPTITLALAMGSQRMARKNVLVKGLSAVEALGAVHVICTDKTGTLTANRLRVTHLSPPLGDIESAGSGPSRLLELALAASAVHPEGDGFAGDPLDVAVAEAYRDRGGDVASFAAGRRRHFAFDAVRRREGGLHACDGPSIFAVKGAWESLRPLLAGISAGNGRVVPADAAALAAAETTLLRLAAGGLRVLAVAWRPLAGERADAPLAELESGLQLAGFLGVEDALRPEVPAAVASCHRAGIDVIMITGDHPETALAVARQAAILPPEAGADRLLRGTELERLTEAELCGRLEAGVRVFARTSPEQKMKIVAALKAMEKVVAMTGDGVNDAPALKAADVGIAMGLGGTDVARATAQIILLDDNFASIVAGVEEGRTVFVNIRKFIQYVLASNVPEILPYLLYILLPVPLALTVIQILSVDLGTDLLPAIALGQESPDPETMEQPPRDPHARLLSPKLLRQSYLFLGLIEAGWSLLLFFLVLLQGGWQFDQELSTADPLYRSATGITLASVLLLQAGNLLGRRSLRGSGLDGGLLRNRLLLLGLAMELFFSWALLYLPPLQRLLGTGPVPWPFYLLAWLGLPLIFGLDWLRKRLTRSPFAETAKPAT